MEPLLSHREEVSSVIVKASVDEADYRFVVLANGLKALLISDPTTDKAAASVDVGAGSLLDPPEFQGLAHFTEHMLFYSSAKYPVEDEYSKFISDHGGHTNAYTSAENTNYQFDVNWEHLAPALDRCAQFFIAPLISADGVEREINAVDSEHGKNLQQDGWRQLQLAKHTANPDHPWSHFSTGNAATLGSTPRAAGLDVRQAVVDFHAQHYSANLMRVAVLGREGLDQLQAMVEAAFAAVPNNNLNVPSFPSDVFLPEQLGKLMKVVPVKEGHILEWAWQTRPQIHLWRQAPLGYISHLLGHEGEGSVFALLKARGWAVSLVAGESGSSMSCASFFYCRVEVTDAGQQHIAVIGEIIFRYLALVRQSGVQSSIHEEVAALRNLGFQYRDKQAPYSYTTSLASAMQHYPDKELLLALYHVPQDYDPALIQELLQEMTPEKARMMWSSKTLMDEAMETEPWYGTRYSWQSLPEDWAARWHSAYEGEDPAGVNASELHLPAPNPFIPTDLSLRSEEAAGSVTQRAPRVVFEEEGLVRMWHKCDLTFPMPKAVVYCDFQCPEAYASPEAAVCTRLFVKLVNDALSELSYPADLAGLTYAVHNSQAGFQVVVSGYSHKLPVLLDAVLDKAIGLQVAADRFALQAEAVGKEYANLKYGQAYSWAMYRRELLLNARRWRVEEYQEELPRLTPSSLQAFITRMLARCFVEGLVVGNMGGEEAQQLAQGLSSRLRTHCHTLPLYPSQMRDLRAVKLPSGSTSWLDEGGPDPANTNSAVSVAYQVGPDDLRNNALLQLLVHLGKRDAFNILRTQQQLGYVVSLFNNHELGAHHLELVVQSSSFPARLGELAQRWWNEVFFATHVFNRPEAEVEALKQLTPQELLEFARRVLGDPATRRKVVVAVRGNAAPASAPAATAKEEPEQAQGSVEDDCAPEEAVHRIDDIASFKRGCETFPSVAGVYALRRACELQSRKHHASGQGDGTQKA
ncbi:insulinase-like metalloprotease [Haematococcus lacustris]